MACRVLTPKMVRCTPARVEIAVTHSLKTAQKPALRMTFSIAGIRVLCHVPTPKMTVDMAIAHPLRAALNLSETHQTETVRTQ